ncbi:MAG: amino acid permease [Candidatus Micrarchaeaceae archaeon]
MQTISVKSATAVGLGAIIGAGIFVLSGTVVALAGPYSLIAFIAVGIVALILAMIMSELSSIMPNAKGASYSFAYKAFGSEIGFVTGIALYASFATAIAAIALGFGTYLASMLGFGAFSSIPFAIVLIIALTTVNLLGISKAAKTDFWLVAIKLSILVLFGAFAIVFAYKVGAAGTIANFAINNYKPSDIFAASVAIFFAYSGFQTIATFASKIKGGAIGAKKAIIGSVAISLIVYVLVDISLMLLAPASKYAIVADPLAFALQSAKAPHAIGIIVDIGALIATTSATLAMILSASRISYQISADGLMPKLFRRFDAKRDVPVNGILLSAAIGIITLFSGNIYVIAAISNFGLMLSYLITCLAQIHFRRQRLQQAITMPLYPYLTIIAIVLLLAFLFGMPKESLIIGNVMVLSLLILYYFLRELKGKKPVKIRLFK